MFKNNGDFWKRGISMEMRMERTHKGVKTAFGLVMGGLLLTSSMVTFVGCENASAIPVDDKPIKPIIEEVVSDWEYKEFYTVVARLEAQYGLNQQGITEQDLKDTIDTALRLKARVEKEIQLKDNKDYYNTVFHSTEVIEKIKHDSIPQNYTDARQGIYDLAALFGIEHKPNKEKEEAEAARLKAEAEAKAQQEAQQKSSSSSSSSKKSSSSSSKSSGSSSKSSSSGSSGSKKSSSGSSSGSKSSSTSSKKSRPGGAKEPGAKEGGFDGPSDGASSIRDYL